VLVQFEQEHAEIAEKKQFFSAASAISCSNCTTTQKVVAMNARTLSAAQPQPKRNKPRSREVAKDRREEVHLCSPSRPFFVPFAPSRWSGVHFLPMEPPDAE
jgi:hypothetical protein